MVSENKRREWIIPILVFILMIYGLFAIRSAVTGDTGKEGYPLRQLIWDVIAVFAMFYTVKLSKKTIRDVAIVIYVVAVILLVIVLFVGREAGGSRRWISLGVVNFQPSELAKLSLVVLLPLILEKPLPSRFFWSFMITLLPVVLIAAEPDLGTAAMISFVWFILLLSSKVSWKLVAVVLVLVFIVAPLIYFFGLKDYQRSRIEAFFNPQKYSKTSAYNVLQSMRAIGSGGIWGKGYMNGIANLFDFVPVDYSDFIVAVIGEELGFVGVSFLVALYSLIFLRMYFIHRVAPDDYWKGVVVGVAAVVFFHVAENLLMCAGAAPVTGVPLPFVSYGGSSALIFGIMMGLVMKAYAIAQIGREVEKWTQWLGSSNSFG